MTTTRAKWILLTGSILAACGAATAGYFLWFRTPASPDPVKAAPQSVLQYMASDAFGKLSEDKRKEYLDQIRQRGEDADLMRQSRSLPKAQQEALQNNVGPLIMRIMQDQIAGYFKTPPEERDAYMDALLDKWRSMRPPGNSDDGSGNPATRPAGPGGGHGFSPDSLQKMIDQTTPAQRAQFAAFMIAARKRMDERTKASSPSKG